MSLYPYQKSPWVPHKCFYCHKKCTTVIVMQTKVVQGQTKNLSGFPETTMSTPQMLQLPHTMHHMGSKKWSRTLVILTYLCNNERQKQTNIYTPPMPQADVNTIKVDAGGFWQHKGCAFIDHEASHQKWTKCYPMLTCSLDYQAT